MSKTKTPMDDGARAAGNLFGVCKFISSMIIDLAEYNLSS